MKRGSGETRGDRRGAPANEFAAIKSEHPPSRVPAARALSVLLGALLLVAFSARPTESATSKASTAIAPSFRLVDTHGHTVTSDSLRGRIVVLNFWAFWCDTWKAELPHLKQLVKHEDDSGFTTVAVSVDGTRYPEFAKLTGDDLPFPVCLDIGSKVTRAYDVEHVPTVVIIDPQGRIAYSHYGYPGNDVVLSQVRRVARASTGSTAVSSR